MTSITNVAELELFIQKCLKDSQYLRSVDLFSNISGNKSQHVLTIGHATQGRATYMLKDLEKEIDYYTQLAKAMPSKLTYTDLEISKGMNR